MKDLDFDVTECAIKAYVSEEDMLLYWAVDIRCAELSFDGDSWRPHARCPVAFRTPLGTHDWRAIFPRRVALADPRSREQDPVAFMYIFEHLPIRRSVLSFGPAIGNSIDVSWQGACDVMYDDRYGTDLPFASSCQGTFVGVRTARMAEALARKSVGKFLDTSTFGYVVDHSGVSSLVPLDPSSPRTVPPKRGNPRRKGK